MLADRLDRIVNQLSRDLVRALREARRADLATILPQLRQELTRAVAKATPAKPRGRPPKAAAKASKAAAKKPAARKTVRAASPKKRGAGSATRLILALLKARREGFRTEEIQRRLKLDPSELQETLQKLLKGGRIARHGQARGTRYSLPNGDGPESSTVSSRRSAAALEIPSEPVAAEPAIEVTEAVIDRVRLLLSESATPVAFNDIQKALGYSRNQVKGLLGHMVKQGFLEQFRAGPTTRYQLDSHGAKTDNAPVRVRKRPHAEGDEAPPAEASAPVAEPPPADDEPPV